MRSAIILGSMAILLAPGQPLSHSQSPMNPAQPDQPPVTFTKKQAAAGRTAYRESCASCHLAKLEGEGVVPSLAGVSFDASWRGKAAGTLLFHIRRMPPEGSENAGTLSEETYANILAYILISNGFEPGDAAIPSSMDALNEVDIPKIPGMDVDPVVPVVKSEAQTALLNVLPNLTLERLQNPSPNDWIHWGRTYEGQSYSPLDKINKENVKNLRMVWRAPLKFGSSMPMPLVHQGVMYLHTYPDTVLAMDATTGDVLWRYARPGLRSSNKKMGVALHEDRVYVSTSSLHMIALNAKTGDLVWDSEIEVEESMRRLIQTRSAPVIAGKVVIQGTIGFRVPKGAFIAAFDQETGAEVWRFYTIAWPDAPGGNTWNDLPVEKRNGGSIWQQGTYDPETNLVYFGIAPTYDTAPVLENAGKPGHNNDAMYTNCTVALNADTGELVWFFQHTQNDQWDMDWAFERTIADIPAKNGGTVRAVMNVGKNAMLDALDAATGEFLFSVETGVQNVITAVDPVTGRKTIDPTKMPNPDTPCVICPIPFGARSWPQTSYSPKTNYVYVPITESCFTMGVTDPSGRGLFTTGVGFSGATHPDLADGMMGRVQAIDTRTQELAWNADQLTPPSTGLLSTGGGLVFSGDIDPSLQAFDDATGEVLWEAPLDDLPSSSLITYLVDDIQYVAVVVGMTNNWVRDITSSFRRFTKTEGMPGDFGGASISVFALGSELRHSSARATDGLVESGVATHDWSAL